MSASIAESNTTYSLEEAFYERGLKTMPLKATFGLLSIVLNGLVIIVFARLNRTFSNLLFISLSLSDLLIGLVFMPLYIVNTTLFDWPFGDPTQLPAVITCLFYLVVQITQWTPSLFGVLLLAGHRFHQLYWPTSASEKMTRVRTGLLVAVWIVPYVVNTARYIVNYNQGYIAVSICTAYVPLAQFVVSSALTSVLPILVSFFLNVANIAGLIRKGLQTRQAHRIRVPGVPASAQKEDSTRHRHGSRTIALDAPTASTRDPQASRILKQHSSRKLRRDVKASTCIGAIILNNLATQYPFAFLWPIEALCNWCIADSILSDTFLVLLAAPVVNPLLLFVFHEHFQQTLSKLVRRLLKRRAST